MARGKWEWRGEVGWRREVGVATHVSLINVLGNNVCSHHHHDEVFAHKQATVEAKRLHFCILSAEEIKHMLFVK